MKTESELLETFTAVLQSSLSVESNEKKTELARTVPLF